MRKDFKKLLHEHSRCGAPRSATSKKIRRKIRQSCGDEDGAWHSTNPKIRRKIIGWDNKELNLNLAPLEHFVAKQVGRLWDKVYSEICQYNKKNSSVGIRVFDRLFDYIFDKVRKHDDGTIHDLKNSGRWRRSELRYDEVYVDPDDGIIKRYNRNKIKRKTTPKPVTKLNVDRPNESIEKIDGIWYHTFYGYITRYRFGYHQDYEVVRKQQLNKKELKEYDISNDAA